MSAEQDRGIVRDYLRGLGDASWTKPTDDGYVEKVVERMATLRSEHPSGDFPSPTHGQDDFGACTECDALRCLADTEEGENG